MKNEDCRKFITINKLYFWFLRGPIKDIGTKVLIFRFMLFLTARLASSTFANTTLQSRFVPLWQKISLLVDFKISNSPRYTGHVRTLKFSLRLKLCLRSFTSVSAPGFRLGQMVAPFILTNLRIQKLVPANENDNCLTRLQ